MSDESKIENEIIIQSIGGNQYVQVEIKEEQRELGTEGHLSASNESGGKGEFSIYSISFITAVSLEVTFFSIQRFIPSKHFYPLFVNSPENLSAQQKLTKSNKLTYSSTIKHKDDRN